jgi:hypothetical protein
VNFKNRNPGVTGLAVIGGFISLGVIFSGAQTPVKAQETGGVYDSIQPTPTISTFNADGYEATPMPTPIRKHLKLLIPSKTQTVLKPTITMVPMGTVAPTPSSK